VTSRAAFPLCGLFGFAALVLLLFLPQNPLSLDDGLRHFTIAQHYRERGVNEVNGWGEFFFTGYFAERELDPWFLADLVYVPFTFIPDPVIGLKVATLSFLLLFAGIFLLLMRRYRASPLLTCLLLMALFFASHGFTSRMLIGRPFVLATVMFLLAYFLILERRWILLGIVMTVTTLLSHLFVFSVFLCGSAVGWLFLQGRWCRDASPHFARRASRGRKKRLYKDSVSCVVFSAAGVLLGLFLHPQTAAYGTYLRDVFFVIPFSRRLGIGAEFGSGIFDADILLFLMLFLSLLLFTLCRVRGAHRRIPEERPEIFLTTFLVFSFLGAYLLWERAIDYLWPLLLLLVLQLASLTPAIEREALSFLMRPIGKKWPIRWMQLLLCMFLVNAGSIAALNLIRDHTRNLTRYAAIESVPSGRTVLNVDWDLFPVLFFLNDRVTYARGMDPSFDYADDPQRYELLERINDRWQWGDPFRDRLDLTRMTFTLQRDREDIDLGIWIDDLRTSFNADYLVLQRRTHPKVTKALKDLPHLSLYSESSAIAVFAL